VSDFWDDDESPAARVRKRTGNPWLPRIAVGVGLVAFVGMVAWGALSLIGDGKAPKRQVVNITLVAPPPPPPPPPPEIKPPEPEVKDEVEVPEPEPAPQAEEAPPAGEQLGLDAQGSGSGDGFGLAAKKGGRDITELGGGNTNRAQFAWFTGLVQSQLQQQLQRNERLRRADYRIVMRVWFASDGRIERYELASSSGNADIDKNLALAMDQMPRLKQPPPADLPQPVRLRVTSRGAG
jgi:protein TonB